MTSLIGQSLDRYHILEQLGEGGMAIVYKAFDTRLETEVAVKVIRTEKLTLETMDKSLKRFAREAKALARLTHPNIIPIIDYGEEDGAPYLVMDFIPGGTLKRKLRGNDPIEWQEAAKLLTPVIRALDYAHKQKIIHRDIKPSNILITESGEPMLTDFGIAKIVEIEETADLTGTSMGVGTPEYMAPEQVTAKTADHRVDIYAMGIILYEMVTGRKPFQADTPMAVLFKHASEPLPRPTKFAPNLPKNVERILLKSLAKNPDYRYQSMGKFADALEKLAKNQGKSAPELEGVPSQKRTRKALPSKMLIWIALALLGIALMFGASRLIDYNQATETFPSQKLTYTPPSTFTYTPAPSPTPQPTSTPYSTTTPTLKATPAWIIGSTWLRSKDGMTMMYIPAGEFQMGSEDGNDDAKPIHTVYIDSFWIDQTEVTNQMYAQCIQGGTCIGLGGDYDDPLLFEFTHPADHVPWFDAQAYCNWVGSRLPTEAEWEKAARGGLEGRKYPWGDQRPSCDNGAENGANFGCGSSVTSVGSYAPNGYGLYDMAGNVREWVSDIYEADYYSTSPSSNPTGPSEGTFMVLRGGSSRWSTGEDSIATFYRSRLIPVNEPNDFGFRCVRDVTP